MSCAWHRQEVKRSMAKREKTCRHVSGFVEFAIPPPPPPPRPGQISDYDELSVMRRVMTGWGGGINSIVWIQMAGLLVKTASSLPQHTHAHSLCQTKWCQTIPLPWHYSDWDSRRIQVVGLETKTIVYYRDCSSLREKSKTIAIVQWFYDFSNVMGFTSKAE